jgi:hypothetical protein
MYQPRVYTVTFQAVAITVSQDLFEITPADDKPVQFLGLFLAQNTDVGDAQDEILRWSCIRGHTTSGSGGSAPTPQADETFGCCGGVRGGGEQHDEGDGRHDARSARGRVQRAGGVRVLVDA